MTLELYGDGNPVCCVSGYRDTILTSITTLQALDGKDRYGRPVSGDMSEREIPELEGYIEFLMSSTSSEQSKVRELRFNFHYRSHFVFSVVSNLR